VCDDADSTGDVPSRTATFRVEAGETVTCTFTNTKQGKIIIDKVTVPAGDPQEFTFNRSWDDVCILADATTPCESAPLVPGTYSVEEVVPEGWDLTSATCSDGSPVNAIDLAAGETVTCRFTDTKRGKIIIEKQTIPDGAAQLFDFTASYKPPFKLSDGQQDDSGWLVPGTYSVAEIVPPGWDLTSAICSDGSLAGAIGLDPGEIVTCVFTNTQRVPGCGFTWGYWKNHNKYQNANGVHRDPGWDKIGEDTQFYGNWDESGAPDPLTWYEILLIPPAKGNAYLILAHQYVAAWLNIHKDADPANPGILGTTMMDAEALLVYYSNSNPAYATFPPEIPKGAANLSGDDRAWAIELGGILDQFNSGTLPGGPPHCGE
jgi:hypothetical protein